MIFGVLDKANLKDILDLSPREIAILTPLVLLTIFFGFYPSPLIDPTAASVQKLIADAQTGVKLAEAAARQVAALSP